MPKIRLCLLLVISTLLCACHDPNVPVQPKVYSHLKSPHTTKMVSKDHKEKTLILPTSEFFQPKTVQLKTQHGPKIAKIERYIRRDLVAHPNTRVLVTGYPLQKQADGLGLSHQYAVVMASYFWDVGLAVRVVDAMANKKELASVKHVLGKHHGVVIHLQR